MIALSRFLLSWVPTLFLQEAFVHREGITIVRLGLEDRRDFSVSGPCIVTLNRD